MLSDQFFLAVSFDASGATTGALTVPFLLALSAGASAINKDSQKSEDDSFGLVGIAPAGAIIGTLVLGMLSKPEFGEAPDIAVATEPGIFSHFIHRGADSRKRDNHRASTHNRDLHNLQHDFLS